MASMFYSNRNLDFLMYEVHDVLSLTALPRYQDHNKKVFDMIFKAAGKLSKDLLYPVYTDMDREQPELVDGEVRVHPAVPKILKEFARGGWLSGSFSYDMDGDQLPGMITDACSFIFSAANYAATAYSGLIIGAAHLIASFGSWEQQEIYLKNMLGGKWQGTMALTEPEAGSSLADLTTMAKPTGDGHYLIKGQKIFISAGDHNGVENVIHLMLARIEGAPAGTKGISLFIVPKKRIEADGSLVPNDLNCSGVYHKLGYRGCPITQLSMGDKNDCHGYLVGDANSGLKYMFQMMNGARIHVGMAATAKSTAAYYAALDYARTRCQGRKINEKDPLKPQIPIIEHADIKRMLLFQKAVNEGSLSLLLQCGKYLDLSEALPDAEGREKYHLLTEILTPIVKTYPAEMGVQAISQGLQVFGGSGYVDDYPLEQYYRDVRIDPIHEGTTGIQGMDLLGRKVAMQEGKAMLLLLEEINQAVSDAISIKPLSGYAGQLSEMVETLQTVSANLFQTAGTKGAEIFLSDATLYLELFGIVTIAWQWLLQAIKAHETLEAEPSASDSNFYQGKLHTFRFFFEYELPKVSRLATRLMSDDNVTVDMKVSYFDD